MTENEPERSAAVQDEATSAAGASLSEMIEAQAQPFEHMQDADLRPLLERIGKRRVVLLGEASHGTAEFYEMRAAISRALIEQKGVRIVALEADWPDAARIDSYVRDLKTEPQGWRAFSRFPTWMWRNREFRGFVDWLREFNQDRPAEDRVAVRGLDIYSMHQSARAVVDHLENQDPDAAEVARKRYGCFMLWDDPSDYGHSLATSSRYQDCEDEVVEVLYDLLRRQAPRLSPDGDRFLDLVQNARLVKNAEHYYRAMYHGGRDSWNVRDAHMFETLRALLTDAGPQSKAVVWAHNSHVGDARATQMGALGQHNIGQLCRQALPGECYLLGFSTHKGTVAAADAWGEPVRIKNVQPSHKESYEWLAHQAGPDRFFLPIPQEGVLFERLLETRIERAIGVIYRPESELASHYFEAVLPRQFDELVWFDESRAVEPLVAEELEGVPETYPFGV